VDWLLKWLSGMSAGQSSPADYPDAVSAEQLLHTNSRALRYDPVGLMIARGDLAMDVGFERLAEMQEELLWFGEACHLPVVWATQVLESVTHSGLPTRAEVTDAAMSMRAECVMLNRGPHVDVANRLLADIIRRMETHQFKKRSLYRRLSLAGPVHSPA
jgi:pyruvate kinase